MVSKEKANASDRPVQLSVTLSPEAYEDPHEKGTAIQFKYQWCGQSSTRGTSREGQPFSSRFRGEARDGLTGGQAKVGAVVQSN